MLEEFMVEFTLNYPHKDETKELKIKQVSMSIKSVPVICTKSVPLEIKNFSPYYPSVFLNFFIR